MQSSFRPARGMGDRVCRNVMGFPPVRFPSVGLVRHISWFPPVPVSESRRTDGLKLSCYDQQDSARRRCIRRRPQGVRASQHSAKIRGITVFVLSDVSDGHSIIMFQGSAIVWGASSGSVTIQTDGNPSFTAQSDTDTKRNLLIVPLANTST